MLDRRPDRQIQREVEQARKARLEGIARPAREVLDALHTYSHLVEFLVVISIIAIVASLLWPNLIQARRAAYVTTCLEKLNELGLAMEMYHIDYGGYPEAYKWYESLAEHMGSMEAGVKPLKCELDHTPAPTSYCYLPLFALPNKLQNWPATDIPMLVDEQYHRDKTTILWRDGHKSAMDKVRWLDMRNDLYRIRRDPQHPEWMCFVPLAEEPTEQGSAAVE